ncbi:MAG TPA: hypothetical protein VGM60_21065 [Pseudonocardia sp.]|jgi:hypothetical protein|uniref:hypothetical protein n=1 Tax=Pseudonocardia sp. TaxID=60912 RepID=UPI002F3F98E8
MANEHGASVGPKRAEGTDADDELPGQGGEHEAPEGAPVHPLIDLTRDPTPGKPGHALPEDEEENAE